jgi:hypothetical protein
MIVGSEQPMTQLVEKIAPLAGNALMLPLQCHDGLAPIGPAFLASGDTALRHAQAFLGSAVPGRMLNVFALAGRDERGKSNINTDINTRGRQRLCSHVTGQDCIPLTSFACESKCLDRAWHLTMPADSHTTNASNLSRRPSTKTHSVLLEAETFEAVPSLEAWIAWLFASFDTTKERLKGFIKILHHGLQHMTVDRTSVGIGGFVGLDLTQLFILADGALFLLVGIFALSKTPVVPMATSL